MNEPMTHSEMNMNMTEQGVAVSDAPEEKVDLTAADIGLEEYGSGSVDVLRDAAHIRQNPTMYIGEGGVKGIHHLVGELLANSVDEALAGFCKNIIVRIKMDGSMSIADDGRGIPVEEHPTEKLSTLEVVMTKVGAGGKFRKGSYKVSAGLHGMGAKAVTALSEWCEAEVKRQGKTYRQEYERGKATTPVTEIGAAKSTGTKISFKPDPEIFGSATFDSEVIEERMRDLAYLNPGLTLSLHDERVGKEATFKFDNGLIDFVQHINRNMDVLHPPVFFEKVQDDIKVQVAFQFTTTEEERVRCFTNNAYNPNGGTHLSGFRSGLTRTLNAYGQKQEFFKKASPVGEDFRKGLTAVLSVHVSRPEFDSQEKRRLVVAEVEGPVNSVVQEFVSKYVEEHPKEAQRIMKKVELEAEAREAAAKAKKALKDRKSILSGGGLPGKLFDCTSRDREESELFLVEGDSAGGSAESGRERHFQAVLPLRGKPLNVEKSRLENMLKNEEISSLISAIGVDIVGDTKTSSEEEGEENGEGTLKRLRYDKIIILTDADVDGQHIRTLLLTFFYRQMPELVEAGHVYVARPPLYKVTNKQKGKQTVRFIQTIEEMQNELFERGRDKSRLQVHARTSATQTEPSGAPQMIEGADLAELLRVATRVEDSLVTLERSAVNLVSLVAKAADRGLPEYRVTLDGHEEWFFTMEEVEAFRKQEQERLGRELVVGDETAAAMHVGHETNGTVAQETLYIHEMHEVRKVNRALEDLKRFGLDAADLIPPANIAGREPPLRLVLEHDETKHRLSHLRELVAEIRKQGERGLSVTRFKGLGEMDPEELWDTTLDPAKRILLQVRLEDAVKADEMFRTLMGEKVEPRRDFIFEHAIRVKDIDYHGA